jgi:Zinc knuckle
MSAGEGGPSGGGSDPSAATTNVRPAPQRYVPEVARPVLEAIGLEELTRFADEVEDYFNFLLDKGMEKRKALEHISRSCFKHAGVKRWACEQLFSDWDDFASKLKAEWLNQSDLRAAGQEFLRKTFQGKGSAQEYGDKFREALRKCELAEFLLTAHVERAIYECGLAQEYRQELGRSSKPQNTWVECERILLELERTGVLRPPQPRGPYNTNSYNNNYRSRNHTNNNNANNKNNNNNLSNDEKTSSGVTGGGRSNDSGGHAPGGGMGGRGVSGSGGRGGRGAQRPGGNGGHKPRDPANAGCHRCGQLGHIARECPHDGATASRLKEAASS